jgi:signal transduction histidine kinase
MDAPNVSRPSPTSGSARRSRVSLASKLSLLTGGVIALCLLIVLAVVYGTLTNSAISAAAEGLTRGTRQIAALGETGLRQTRLRYIATAHDPAIRRALLANEEVAHPVAATAAPADTVAGAAHRVLSQLSAPTDSGLPIELWTAGGQRLAVVGATDPVVPETASRERPLGTPRIPRTGIEGVIAADSLQLGRLYSSGGRVYYWLVVPVLERGRAIGYIAQQRRIAVNSQVDRSIRALAGEGVSGYYHNADGSVWATVGGSPASPSRRLPNDVGHAVRGSGEQVLIDEEHIGGTPFVVAMEYPLRDVLARPRSALRRLLVVGVALLIAGMGAALFIGHRVARPLVAIADGAEAIARGQYDTRVAGSGEVEIGRLANSFNHMANEVATAHRALERQTADARAANRAKSDFLATMSHELRTPLNAITGYAELLEMELRGPITAEQRRDLVRIRASGQHLLGLISGVLDLARIERGQVTYDLVPIAIEPFLSDLDALVSPQATAKSLTLEYQRGDSDLAVVADREKLRQVVLNLLSNAIRFTPSGGRIILSSRAIDGSRVDVCVEDTGPGIPAARQEQVFEPFVQLDRSLTQTQEGLGLGLAISRDLARGMGGDLTLQSHPDAGARFVLTLPRAAAERAGRAAASGALAELRPA